MQEVLNFKKIARRDADALSSCGVKAYDRKVSHLDFFSKPCMVLVQVPMDEADFKLHADLTTTAVNGGQVPMTVYEALVFQKSSIPHTASTIKIPDELLGDIRNRREAINELIGNQPMTFGDMKKLVNGSI